MARRKMSQAGDATEPSDAELDRALAESMDASDPPSFGGAIGVGAPPASEPAPELIRERAYELWLEAGRPDGAELDFWLRAERELAPISVEDDSERLATDSAA